MKIHPYAELFPMMSDEEIKVLSEDIGRNGLEEPVVVMNGAILDGRNRWVAAKMVQPEKSIPTKEYDGDESNALAYVISKNLHRRHLTTGQRAMIAADLANMTVGGDRKSDHSANSLNDISVEKAAGMLDVSTNSVTIARKIQRAAPKLAQEIRNGKVKLNATAKKVRPSPKPRVAAWKAILYEVGGTFLPGWSLDAANSSSTHRDAVQHAFNATGAAYQRLHNASMPSHVIMGSNEAKAVAEAYRQAYLLENPEQAPPLVLIREEVPESDKAKFDRLMKKAEVSLRANIEAEIRKRVDVRCNEIRERMHKKEMDLVAFERRLQARAQGQGFMKEEEFKLILGCLHPDREASAERKGRAFDVFNKLQFGVKH